MMSIELFDGKRNQHYPYNIDEFSEKLGKTLEAIGLADNGHITIVKDEENKIYCADGCLLFYVSNTLDEAIKILNKDRWPKFKVVVELD